MATKNQFLTIVSCLLLGLILRYVIVAHVLERTEIWWIQALAIILIMAVGIGYIFRQTTKVIEETTDVLKDRTGLAGGLLQALGTAFPDMVIGVVAAVISLQVRDSDYLRAVNLAIIAASATFGSNIYNIAHATWCVYRQNLANIRNKAILMFPAIRSWGSLKPLKQHKAKPSVKEMDNAIRVLLVLTLLTAFIAISMVIFGRVSNTGTDISGDLYRLIKPIGIILFILCLLTLFSFRKSHRPESPDQEVVSEEKYYARHATWRIWLDLVLSGVAILFAAESMVQAMEIFSRLTNLPYVITGILAGIIGCFGEMMVIHNFSINPNGRIGDAITGVAMDNIVTVLGASIVALMGGIFLGGNALILIFIIILTANTLLIGQISTLKNNLHRG